MAGPVAAPQPPKVKHYDLRKGIYSVAISIGKTRQSALQEGAEEIGQLLQAAPQLMPLIGPLYFKYRDFPGAKEISDLLAKVRDKQFPGLSTGEDGQPSPEQMNAQMQGMAQQMKMMEAQLQAAVEQIRTEQAKQQTVLAKAQMDNEAKVMVAKIEQETKLLLESLTGKLEQIQAALKMGHEREMQASEQSHEAVMAAAAPALAVPEFTGTSDVELEEFKEV
jgi:hypothetical protein